MNKSLTATDHPAVRRLGRAARAAGGERVTLQTSQFIARLVGPVLCAIGIGMLADEATYRALAGQFLSGYGFIYFSGILMLLAGVSTFRLIAPRFVAHAGGLLFLSDGFFFAAGSIFLALGAFFVFKGYAT